MPKLAANLSMLFTEYDFLDRFRAAADAGFEAVECQFPYAYDPSVLKQKLVDHGLVQVLHNAPAGDWAGGERGIACRPDRVAEFEAGIDQAIAYAAVLGCRQINCLAGIRPPDLDVKDARATFVRNLRYAAPRLKAAGINLLIEAINTRDVPGFFLSRTSEALEIIETVHVDNLFLQYDVYHMQIMEGDLAPTIERNLSRIAHIQIADSPGRHEPGSGEIHYPFLLTFLDRIGYSGWVSAEYTPAAGTEVGLGWADKYLSRTFR
jgi:hydroxypyruvate isomerase